MTHQEILNKTKAEIDSLCVQAKEKLDAIAPREAEVGKWYKDPNSQYLVHVTKIIAKHNYVEVYGFDCNGNWFNEWDTVVHQLCIEATPQEVENALIEEAKRRYKVGDKIFLDGENRILDMNLFQYLPKSNSFYISLTTKGKSGRVFNNGQWATIIEQDKFAKLKEAHRNGAVIQHYNVCLEEWADVQNPMFNENAHYRIKPEEKPKVGDVVRAWNDDECEQYFIGIVHEISDRGEFKVKFRKGDCFGAYYYYARYAKTITQQEAIDLLFNNK